MFYSQLCVTMYGYPSLDFFRLFLLFVFFLLLEITITSNRHSNWTNSEKIADKIQSIYFLYFFLSSFLIANSRDRVICSLRTVTHSSKEKNKNNCCWVRLQNARSLWVWHVITYWMSYYFINFNFRQFSANTHYTHSLMKTELHTHTGIIIYIFGRSKLKNKKSMATH